MNKYKHFGSENELVTFSDKGAWRNYSQWLLNHIKVCLALSPSPRPCELAVNISGKYRGAGYTCEKVYFQSLPGIYVTGNLFRPEGAERRLQSVPAILSPHGHWQNGRLHDFDERNSVVARCIHFARMGATVFTWDMVGFNDSCQLTHDQNFPYDPHWGLSMMTFQTWNSVRTLDFVLSLPEVDPSRIGITGASGGATQAIFLCAVDDRISASAPVCMISRNMQGGCYCENTPLLRIDATNVEIAALHAPKPMFIGSCTGDWTKNVPEKEYPAIASIYRFFQAEHQLTGYHVNDIHNYNRDMYEHVAGFFNQKLLGKTESAPVISYNCKPPPLREMMVWWGRPAPDPVSNTDIIRLWREHIASAQKSMFCRGIASKTQLSELLFHTLGASPFPWKRISDPVDYLVFCQESDTLEVTLSKKHRPLRRDISESVQRFFTTYNLPDAANETLALMERIDNTPAIRSLKGSPDASIACLAAGALSPQIKSVEVDTDGFNPDSYDSWRDFFDVPCIRQIGGMSVIFSLLTGKNVKLNNASAAMLKAAARYLQTAQT